jgi:hypothetical protein
MFFFRSFGTCCLFLLYAGLPTWAAADEPVKPPAQKEAAPHKASAEAAAKPEKKASEKKAPLAAADDKTEQSPDPQANRRTALVWRAVVKVVNPDEARAEIDKEARSLGGFPTYFNGRSILLKIPPGALSVLTEKIAAQGLILEKTLDREDVTLRIAELEGRLKSKRDILARTRKFLDDSDVSATLDIERTMTGLVMEIEQLRGALRVLKDKTTYAVADISFEFRERDKIVYVQSPFEWLNTVDLARFNEEF